MKKSLCALSVFTFAALLTLQLFSCNNGVSPVPASDYNYTSDLDTIINPDHPKAARYQAFLDSLTRAGMVGVSVLVSTPKDGIWAGSSGMADIAAGAPMKPGNLFRIMSVTKLYTAAAILKLAERGLLDINKKAADYLPEDVVNKIANCDKAGVYQLLDHTGGIPELHTSRYFIDQYNNPSKKWNQMDLLNEAVGEPAVCAPGERGFYTDLNYILLGMIIEQVTGKGYDQFIREEILSPLALNHTFLDKNNPTPAGTVRGYQDIRGNGKIEDCSILWDHVIPGAEGGVITDVFDLYVFADALFRGTLLNDSSMNKKWPALHFLREKPYATDSLALKANNSTYGHWVGHRGGERGYDCNVMYFIEKDVFVIWFSNGPYRDPYDNGCIAKAFMLNTEGTKPFYDIVFK
jgi:D-alanyl-D-alanine carboxypeptidase